MIYILIIIFAFIAPFFGIIAMENGVYGLSVDTIGYRNHASEAYALYLFSAAVPIFLLYHFLIKKADLMVTIPTPLQNKLYNTIQKDTLFSTCFGLISLFLLSLMAVYLMFYVGGWRTMMGMVGRGEFRAGLGSHGALSYLTLKYYGPALFAALCLIWQQSERPWLSKIIIANALALSLIALSFGFKSGIVTAFLPAAIICLWKVNLLRAFMFCVVVIGVLIGGFYFLDSTDRSFFDIINAIIYRLFILQGDVPWKLWDLYQSDFPFPDYTATLPAIMGDRLFTLITSIEREPTLTWINTHFGLLITYLSGYPIETIMAGHNNTATAFGEGIIAGGYVGIIFFGALAGTISALLYHILSLSLRRSAYIIAPITASYSVVALMSWLIGGGVTSLMHISILFGILTTSLMLWILLNLTVLKLNTSFKSALS